jgi:hypothetical protein
MANNNNMAGMVATNNSQIKSSGLTLPSGFNESRKPNELERLLQTGNNSKTIYNKFKLKTGDQPFIVKAIGSHQGYFGEAADDVIRVTKWNLSTTGLLFTLKQFGLQGLNAFNETKLYNPASPILGAISRATDGLITPPTRFIEPNAYGILNATGLGFVSDAVGLSVPVPPKGTVYDNNSKILSAMASGGGKGLLRGQTATNADQLFTSKWGTSQNSSLLSKIGNFFKANTAVGTFLPVTQPNGEMYKVGEKSYGIFLNDKKNGLFKSPLYNGITWDNSGTYIQKYSAELGGDIQNSGEKTSQTFKKLNEDSDEQVGTKNSENLKSNLYEKLKSYVTSSHPSNFNSTTDKTVLETRDVLNSILNSAKGYSTDKTSSTYIAQSYNDLVSVSSQGDKKSGLSPENYNSTGNFKSYDFKYKNNKNTLKSRGIDTNIPDSINYSGILNGDSTSMPVALTETLNYNSDLIAFYFHDLVNNVYIPFRATVKGLQESLSANWEEVKYINRADKLYAYGGFTRTLSFNFTVVVTSIKELMPTWKRLNYFVGLTKPSNYTSGNVYSRFIVPPLINFTIGDMYKNQPAVITQIGVSIPDDASWELTPEVYKGDWTYLNDRIKYVGSGNQGKFAQVPTSCELTVQMNLLEKEIPHVGGSNYGDYFLDTQQFYVKGASGNASFSKNIYVQNVNHADEVISKYE